MKRWVIIYAVIVAFMSFFFFMKPEPDFVRNSADAGYGDIITYPELTGASLANTAIITGYSVESELIGI